MRKIAAIVVAAAFVASLAACSDLPAQVQGCTPNSTAGSASNAISASGKFGSDPKTHVPTPTVSSRIETSVLSKGSGMELGNGDVGVGQVTVYDGATGKPLFSSAANGKYSDSTQTELSIGNKKIPFSRYLDCQTVGSRTATIMSATNWFGDKATATSNNFSPTATFVVVTDITKGFRGRATGVLQPPQAGFPSVVTSTNGTPGITLDLQSPPKTLQWEVVRRGSGEKVKAGEGVLLQVQGIEWTNPAPTTTFDSTWTTGTPRPYVLTALTSADGTNSLDPGSVKALVGQTVGSQVLVVVPPKFGYPSGKAPSGYPTGSTLIYVYDVIGVIAK